MRTRRLAAWLTRPAARRFHAARALSQTLDCFSDIDLSWEWLKDPGNPRLQRFLKLERTYLANQLAKPRFRRVDRTFNIELRNRLLRDNYSVPECIGPFEYYMRQAPGENFPVYYRRYRDVATTSTERAEQVVLNQNIEPLLAHAFQVVTGMKISPDGTQVLVLIENDREQCRAMLKDLQSGALCPLDDIVGIKNAEWSSTTARVFYFTKVDDHGRPFAVYRYHLATRIQELVRDGVLQCITSDCLVAVAQVQKW